MTPPAQQKPKFSSPTFSSLGRSPSFAPPPYTTDDLLAARNQKFSRWVYLLRIGIAAITLGTSVAIVACAGVALRAYSESHLEPEWLLPLWPQNVDLRPTKTVLGCGVSILVLSLVYLAASFAPMACHLCTSIHIRMLTGPRAHQNSVLSISSPQLPPFSHSSSLSSPPSSHPSSPIVTFQVIRPVL